MGDFSLCLLQWAVPADRVVSAGFFDAQAGCLLPAPSHTFCEVPPLGVASRDKGHH